MCSQTIHYAMKGENTGMIATGNGNFINPGRAVFARGGKSVCHQTPTEAGAWDYSEGLVPQYFDVSFYIVKLLLYNLIQTFVFDKCNIQFLPREDKGDREGILHTHPIP